MKSRFMTSHVTISMEIHALFAVEVGGMKSALFGVFLEFTAFLAAIFHCPSAHVFAASF